VLQERYWSARGLKDGQKVLEDDMAKKKIPKKIAGIKIPKVLRKNSLLKSLVGTAAGRQIVADALKAAAGAAAAALVASRMSEGSKGRDRKSGIAEASEDGIEIVQRALKDAADAMTEVLGKAAQAAMGHEERNTGKHRRAVTTH
jgi:hypothetical protein